MTIYVLNQKKKKIYIILEKVAIVKVVENGDFSFINIITSSGVEFIVFEGTFEKCNHYAKDIIDTIGGIVNSKEE